MKYTRCGSDDVLQLRRLWKEVFEDSDAFLDLFFERIFPNCDTFAARDGETVIAMLFALPQSICCAEQTKKAAYVYAAAVKKEYRGQGVFRGLMEFCKKKLQNRFASCILLACETAELAEMYRKLGFEGCRMQFEPAALPKANGEAMKIGAVDYAGIRETVLFDTPHVRYDKTLLEFEGVLADFYALQTPTLAGCAAVRKLPDGRLRCDELLPDRRILPALAAALGEKEILLVSEPPRFMLCPLQIQKTDMPYAAFFFD